MKIAILSSTGANRNFLLSVTNDFSIPDTKVGFLLIGLKANAKISIKSISHFVHNL